MSPMHAGRPFRYAKVLLAGGAALCTGTFAWAHPGHFGHPALPGHGFADGWAHPFHGWDHVLAMLAVGLLAARAGGHAQWAFPATFLAALLAGGALAAGGVPGFGVEYAIAVSVIVFGGLLALVREPSWRWEAAIVALFALFHGHAHAAELSAATSFASVAGGFLAGTAVLLAGGIAAGLSFRRVGSARALRFGGGAIAVAGVTMLATFIR